MAMTCINGSSECTGCAETWEQVKGYESYYLISSCGNVYSLRNKLILKPVYDRNGYVQVGLSVDGKEKKMKIHRLVAETFIPNFENKPHVNHLNEVKDCNCYKNLEWATPFENLHYGTCIERGRITQGRKIVQKTMDGKVIKIWNCSTDLKKYGFWRNEVWKCCNGKAKQHKGYLWEYKEEKL